MFRDLGKGSADFNMLASWELIFARCQRVEQVAWRPHTVAGRIRPVVCLLINKLITLSLDAQALALEQRPRLRPTWRLDPVRVLLDLCRHPAHTLFPANLERGAV